MALTLPSGFYVIEKPIRSGLNFAVCRSLSEVEKAQREQDGDKSKDPVICRGSTSEAAVSFFLDHCLVYQIEARFTAKYPQLDFDIVWGSQVGAPKDGPVLEFWFRGTAIIDPTTDEDCFFAVDPTSYYGISAEDAKTMRDANFTSHTDPALKKFRFYRGETDFGIVEGKTQEEALQAFLASDVGIMASATADHDGLCFHATEVDQ